MTPYVVFSAVVHAGIISFLLWVMPAMQAPRKYYVIDFMGGQSGMGPGRMQPAPAPAGGSGGAAQTPKLETPPPPPPQPDARKVVVAKEAPKPGNIKKGRKEGSPKAPRNRGLKGGRGVSAEGKGDINGMTTGAVGGAGTSLEIGGFGPGGSLQAGPRFPYPWYVQTIYKRLWESWDRTDVGNKECGVVFTIGRDGSATDVKVEETSGDAFFDLTARRAVGDAAPFPPLPEGYAEPRLRVFVKFRLQ